MSRFPVKLSTVYLNVPKLIDARLLKPVVLCMIQGEKLASCDSVRDEVIDDLANGYSSSCAYVGTVQIDDQTCLAVYVSVSYVAVRLQSARYRCVCM
jgi:hypothetical protein